MKQRKGNHTFDQDPGKFYGHLRDILNQDKDKKKYEENSSSNNSKQTSSLTKEDFEQFWVPIWQNDQEGNLTSERITEVWKGLKEASPTQDNSPITMTKKTLYNCAKKKINWTSPGLDKITNFWIKEFSTLHAPLADAITTLINDSSKSLPSWLAEGRTVMLPKKDNPIPQDFRLITCLNTMLNLSTMNLSLSSCKSTKEVELKVQWGVSTTYS